MKRTAAITAVGGYVPDKVLTNRDLEKLVETNDRWIRERTGISERRILEDGHASSDMAVHAVHRLLDKTSYRPEDIDMILVATVTPDHMFPATANIIQDKIGAVNAWGFDMNAACSGFLFALTTGAKYVESGMADRVLVVGVDTMSSIINYEDRNTCILFGDGAGCVLLEPNKEGLGLQDSKFKVDGSGRKLLIMQAGGSLHPASVESVESKMHYVFQDGKPVFKSAVKGMADITVEVMEENNLKGEDIAFLVPHQANKRIIDATAKRAGIPDEKVMVNIHKYGNTTSATIPLCLWEWEEKLKKGDKLMLAAFGGGFAWGATYLTWAYDAS
jgi:3-oxoacyl-[acyl-carrier-protein] synthase-3